MKLLKKAALLAAAALTLGLISCKQDSGSTTSNELPGTIGGKGNKNDTFYGKTFYDNADKNSAYTCYEFSEEGTVTVKAKMSSSEDFTPVIELKYSISDDGENAYMKVLKAPTPEAAPRLLSEEEFITYAKQMLASQLKKLREERPAAIDSVCYGLDIPKTSSDNEIIEAQINNYKKTFSSTYTFTLKTADSPKGTLTEVIAWKNDLSNFMSMEGSYTSKKIEDVTYYAWVASAMEGISGYYNATSAEDDNDNGVSCAYSKTKNKFINTKDGSEIPYTISDDGTKITITADGKEMVAVYNPQVIELFEAAE